MEVKLEKQWCGHVQGAKVSVSEDRAYAMMVADIARPDKAFLAKREKELKALQAKAAKSGKKKDK